MLGRHPIRLFGLFLCVALAVALAGCGSEGSGNPPSLGNNPSGQGGNDNGGNGGTNPTDSFTVTLATPQPETITVGGTASTLTATLVDDTGAPVSGQSVLFTASPATVGSLSAASASTDDSGQASVTVTGLRAGQTTITALYEGASATASVTVVLPQITLQTEATEFAASSPGAGGAAVTATIRDASGVPLSGLSVSFSTTLGQLTTVTAPAAGQYRATLTSTRSGLAVVTASVSGAQSDAVDLTVQPGPLTSLRLTPSPSQIPPDGATASTISIVAEDEFGNSIDGTVDLTTTRGTLSQDSVDLVDGQAEVTFTSTSVGTAQVTGTMATAPGIEGTADVVIVQQLAGEPANILVTVAPELVTVAGVGGSEVATVTVEVVDNAGDPIDDSGVLNNLEIEIVDGPGGGENINGNTVGQTLTLSTVGGTANASFQSGVLPGTVRMEVRVVKKSNGVAKVPPLTAVVPQITIDAGPPFSLFLGRSTRTADNADGTYTTDHFAIVSDRYGNAVPDNTAVSFGQFINILSVGFDQDPVTGQMINGDGSISAGNDAFSSPSATFVSDGVTPGDTLAILNGTSQGGYIVKSVDSETTLTTFTTFQKSETALQFAVGNNGGDGGTVITPSGEAATLDGVATWPDTYSVELINEPVFIYAETEGRKLGDARLFGFPFLIPVTVEVQGPTSAPAPVNGVGTKVDFQVFVSDGGNPKISIPNLGVRVSVGIAQSQVAVNDGDLNGTGSNSITAVTGPAGTNQRGLAEFYWTVPSTAQAGDSFTLTLRADTVTETVTVDIE